MNASKPRRDYRVLNPYLLVLLRSVARGRVLGSDGDWCWLYEVDESKPTFDESHRRVRPVASEVANHLVLGGWVRTDGTLTDNGRAAAGSTGGDDAR